jgi:hypothetical protein
LFEIQGDQDGKAEGQDVNELLNTNAPFSVYGRSTEINFPTDQEMGRGDATRNAAIGN